MKITAQTSKLKEITYALDKALYDGSILFFEDRAVIRESAPGNHWMINIELETDFFETYEPEVAEHIDSYGRDNFDDHFVVGINFENLHTLVKSISSDTSTLTLEESRLVIKHDANRFDLPVLNIDVKEIDVQELSYATTIEVEAGKMKQNIEKLLMTGAAIRMSCDKDNDTVELESENSAMSGSLEFEAEDVEGRSVMSLFNGDYMKIVVQAIRKLVDDEKMINVEFGQEKPVKFELDPSYDLKYMIAPKIEEDW